MGNPGPENGNPTPKKKKEKILNALGNPQRPTSVASQTTDLNWEELLGRK